MRIAFDHQTFCQQTYGGISRYIVRLSENLIRKGHDVAIFAPFHRNNHLKNISTGNLHGCNIGAFPYLTTTIFTYINHLLAKHGIKGWRPQLIHETYYSRRKIAKGGIPLVITVHDMIHELYCEKFNLNDHTTNIKRLAVNRADHIICVSENTRNDLINLFEISPKKTSVVYHGFDSVYNSNSQFNMSSFSGGRPFLLYVGNRGRYKNFRGFLAAFSSSLKLKYDFDIVAFGGGPFSRDEKNTISELGLRPEQVRYAFGSDDVLGAFYGRAHAFVYPSLYEGFGFPPLESMAHSCPVISSNTSSMPEIIGNAAEFFNPLYIDDIVRAIENVVYSNSYISELVSLGLERIEKFSWDKCAIETLRVYDRTINLKN